MGRMQLNKQYVDTDDIMNPLFAVNKIHINSTNKKQYLDRLFK
jgi:hypothetical protein